MTTEMCYCNQCRRDTRHYIFNDGLIPGERANAFERGFFAITTFGLSELMSDTWRQCQVCDKKVKI